MLVLLPDVVGATDGGLGLEIRAARDGRHGLPTWLKLTLPGVGERRSRGGRPCVPVAS